MDTALNSWDIKGKVCLITGANCGIGRETALQLVKLGAGRVILACRNLEAGEAAVDFIRQQAGICDDEEDETERRISLQKLDLSSLTSVRQFAKHVNETEKQLHVLINNAGVYPPNTRTLTEDGFELSFATNHLGHFLLTNLLLDLLKRSAPSRIVVVAALAYKFCWPYGFHIDDPNYEKSWYQPWLAYCQTKLANILFARALHRRINESCHHPSGVTVYSLHPGVIATNLARHHWILQLLMTPLQRFLSSMSEGAATTVYCATQPGIEQFSGSYFTNCDLCETWSMAKDDVTASRLWELSERLVASGSH